MTIPQYMAQKQIEGGVDLPDTDEKVPVSSLLTGEQDRRYKLGKMVARGGMGAILDAVDVNLRRAVAMKVLLEPDKVGTDEILRFIQEARITSQLEHPSIVPVHELGVDGGGNVFYTMKFLKGHTLRDILKKIHDGDVETIKNYPLPHLLTIFQKVCDAVGFAHSKGVIHRDLKPENVMVGDYGEVQVMDWGLAKVLPRKGWKEVGGQRPEAESPPRKTDRPRDESARRGIDSVRGTEIGEILKTMDGAIMGTPEFMSPEQALGKTEEIDERTDIYALGAMLFNILTLDVPVKGRSLEEIIEKVSTGAIKKPTEYNQKRTEETTAQNDEIPVRSQHAALLSHCPDGRIPDSLSAVTMRALEFEAYRRYQSIKEFQREIEAYQGGFATKAEKAGLFKQAALFIKRNKAASIGTAAVLLIGCIFGARAAIEGRLAQQALADLKGTAPAFAAQARLLVENKKFDEAAEKIGFAIRLDGTNAEYRRVRALALQAAVEKSRTDEVPLDPELKREIDTVITSQLKSVMEQPDWSSERLVRLSDGSLQLDLHGVKVADLTILQGLPISSLDLSGCSSVELAPLHSLQLKSLILREARGVNLDGLRAMALQSLDLSGNSVTNLSMLQGMPLKRLNVSRTRVKSLKPLRGMPLERLDCAYSGVESFDGLQDSPLIELNAERCYALRDISALHGLPLKNLSINSCRQLHDLSPLEGCLLLENLLVPSHISDVAVLRKLPNLKRASNFGLDAFQGSWGRILPAAEFLKMNGPRLVKQAQTEMQLENFRRSLVAQGNTPEKVPHWNFDVNGELTITLPPDLKCSDLSGLRGVAVNKFVAYNSSFSDLSPLTGAPLHELTLYPPCKVFDLSPLRDAPLEVLSLTMVPIRDISALRRMPLKTVFLKYCHITDVSPLADIPTLEMVLLPPTVRNVEVLRHHPKIALISYTWNVTLNRPDLTAAEFWKKYDEGGFPPSSRYYVIPSPR